MMVAAIAGGVVLGFVYTLSPMSVWFAVLAGMLLWAAHRNLPPREARRWPLSLLRVPLSWSRSAFVPWADDSNRQGRSPAGKAHTHELPKARSERGGDNGNS